MNEAGLETTQVSLDCWDPIALDECLDDMDPQEALSSDTVKFLYDMPTLLDDSAPRERTNIEPEELDIICGRDKTAHSHRGNKRFRAIVKKTCERYQNATTREAKTRITTETIAFLSQGKPGGRFLKFDQRTRSWHDVGKEYAHEKVSHALRSAKPPIMRSVQARRRRPRATKPPTEKENKVFQLLLEEQQKIFKASIREIPIEESSVADFSLVDRFCQATIKP